LKIPLKLRAAFPFLICEAGGDDERIIATPYLSRQFNGKNADNNADEEIRFWRNFWREVEIGSVCLLSKNCARTPEDAVLAGTRRQLGRHCPRDTAASVRHVHASREFDGASTGRSGNREAPLLTVGEKNANDWLRLSLRRSGVYSRAVANAINSLGFLLTKQTNN
jgi:hypothetical protein